MVGVGASTHNDPSEAGRESASRALQQTAGTQPGWAMAFCGGQHEPGKFLQGLRSELGPIHIVGGSTIGTITNDMLGYTGFECAVAVFPSSIPQPVFLTSNQFNGGTREPGRDLGQQLRTLAKEGSTVVIFYDSIKSGPPPVLHVGSQLVDGLYEGLSGFPVNIVGAGTIGDFGMTQSFIFDGSRKTKHAAVAAVFPPAITSHTEIMHGCIPVSSFYEVTKIEGAVLYELDGMPAAEVVRSITGEDLSSDHPALTITLGEKRGDPFAPYDETSYINRLILAGNPDDGSVILFEADYSVGSRIQIMSRNYEKMIESAQQRTAALISSLGSTTPLWSLYINCAGRSCAFSGGEVEEARIVQQGMGPISPFLGFYSGVEIAPLLGRSRPLDWTGVLTAFTMDEGF